MSDIIYTFKNNAYFNITNRCTCKCMWCQKVFKDWDFCSYLDVSAIYLECVF